MSSFLLRIQSVLHKRFARSRRTEVLSREIAALVPEGCSILDVGCGSGEIASEVARLRSCSEVRGVDVVVQPGCRVPVERYDGLNIPWDDKSVDLVMLIDVLHHTDDPMPVIREALRVAKLGVIIKDHNCDSRIQRRIMTFTDSFANRHNGVPLPFNFWSTGQWAAAWRELHVKPDFYNSRIELYPALRGAIFARDMDFIVRLPVGESGSAFPASAAVSGSPS